MNDKEPYYCTCGIEFKAGKAIAVNDVNKMDCAKCGGIIKGLIIAKEPELLPKCPICHEQPSTFYNINLRISELESKIGGVKKKQIESLEERIKRLEDNVSAINTRIPQKKEEPTQSYDNGFGHTGACQEGCQCDVAKAFKPKKEEPTITIKSEGKFYSMISESIMLYGDCFVDWFKTEGTNLFYEWAKKKGIDFIMPKKEEPAMELNEVEELAKAKPIYDDMYYSFVNDTRIMKIFDLLQDLRLSSRKAREMVLEVLRSKDYSKVKLQGNLKVKDVCELPLRHVCGDYDGVKEAEMYNRVVSKIRELPVKLKFAQPSNHNEMCGVHDGECFVCKEQTNSYGANPSIWSIFLPHIDGQTKHRFYHIKCLYPLVKIAQHSISREEIENIIRKSEMFKASERAYNAETNSNIKKEIWKSADIDDLTEAILNHLESRKKV